MVSKETVVIDKMGLHMRPANNFIMAACIKYGSHITITCEGEDEQQMLDEAVKLIESGLE